MMLLIAAIAIVLIAGILLIMALVKQNDELSGNRLKFVMGDVQMTIVSSDKKRMKEVSMGITLSAFEHPAENEIRAKPFDKNTKERN